MFENLLNFFCKIKDIENEAIAELTAAAKNITTVEPNSLEIAEELLNSCRLMLNDSETICVFPINKRGRQRYMARYRGDKDLFGKRKNKEFLCDSYEEGVDKLMEFINNLQHTVLDVKNFTLEEWLRYYLDAYKATTVKPKTYEKSEAVFRNYIYINKSLCNIKLCNLTTDHLEIHYRKLMQSGASSLTLKNNNKSLITALNYAVKRGYINRNPATALAPIFPVTKKNEEVTSNYLTANQIDSFLNNLTKYSIDILLKFSLLTGMRLGEVLALKWSDIDFEKREISVNKSLVRLNKDTLPKIRSYKYKIVSPPSVVNNPNRKTVLAEGPTKNNKNRKVNISSKLIDDLYLLFDKKKGDLVFHTIRGSYIDSKAPGRRLHDILDNLALDEITMHGLRHTFASILFEANIDAETTAVIIGDTVETTNKFYIHITPSKRGQAIKALDSYLS